MVLQPPLQIDLQGQLENRPNKYMICRDGLVGATGQTTPTKGYKLPLKNISVVVASTDYMDPTLEC